MQRVVVEVESNAAIATAIIHELDPNRDANRSDIRIVGSRRFQPNISDESGGALFRQIDTVVTKLLREISDADGQTEVDIVLPGSLENRHTIDGSSRLNIRGRCCLTDILGDRALNYSLTSDVYLSALGQLEHCLDPRSVAGWRTKLVLFVYVNEGVGSLILNNGTVIRGAGYGGPLGLVTVERKGQYFDEYRARGVLETYCSRPWMSAHIVNAFLSERAKSTAGEDEARLSGTPLRRALNTIAMDRRTELQYGVINSGLEQADPLALTALSEACDYLGLAISHLIVTLNPHIIVLDGQMIHALRGMYEATRASTRRYTFPVAWNTTTLLKSVKEPLCTLYGAAYAATHNITYYQR